MKISEDEKLKCQNKLSTWLGFQGESREIRSYQSRDESNELLIELAYLGVIEFRKTPKNITIKIPDKITLNRLEKIMDFYGEYIPLFSQKLTKNYKQTLYEILSTHRRSENILRPHDAVDTPDWKFFVPEYFNDALDIKLVSRKKNLVEYSAWTQGINFAFDSGDVLYRDRLSYEKGTPAIQVISAKKAQGTEAEKLNTGDSSGLENYETNIESEKYDG